MGSTFKIARKRGVHLVNREPGITEREPKSPMIASPAANNCKAYR